MARATQTITRKRITRTTRKKLVKKPSSQKKASK